MQFLEPKWWPNDLEGQDQWPMFDTIWENPKMHIWGKFGDSSSNPLQVSGRQAKFPRIPSQNGQNDLKDHGQYQLRVSQDACLVQIWWFQLKSVTSYGAVKVKLMDRQTSVLHIWYKYQVKLDAPHSALTYLCSHLLADRRRQRQYPFCLKGQGVKTLQLAS